MSLSPSNGVPLTEQLILQKTKLENLAAVKNVNLWGCEINDLSILSRLPNLEVLTLSVNNVATLKDFASCKHLREIYLRKNEVAHLGEVQYLASLPQLHTLWLCDNPCASHPLYRQFVIHACPALRKLDNADVAPAERESAKKLSPAQIIEVLSAVPEQATTTVPAAAAVLQSNQQQQPRGGAPLGNNPSSTTSIDRPLHQAPSTSSVTIPQQTNSTTKPPPSSASGSSSSSSRSTEKAVVSSILTLLGTLSNESLEFLKKDINERLNPRR